MPVSCPGLAPLCWLLDAGLRQEDIVSFQIDHTQLGEGRWIIADSPAREIDPAGMSSHFLRADPPPILSRVPLVRCP